jgi:hypothetical protein
MNNFQLVSYSINKRINERGMIVLTYTKLKEILDRYPHCFKTVKEKEEEFDRLVERIEKRPITFIRSDRVID